MKPRLLILLLGALGVGLLLYTSKGAEPDDALAEPLTHGTKAADAVQAPPRAQGSRLDAASAPHAESTVLALQARRAPAPRGESGGRLFAATSWAPPPSPPPPPVQPASQAPVAPPLPFVVIGRQNLAGVDQVLLAQGERLLGVRTGTVIDGRYRVDAIGAHALTLVYLPLNQIQQLAIRAAE
ncbi:MAG: hypothetical protein JO006_19060 [Paucibacter sp.]|nr:hypothetical protein [Roseateles sp.]